MILCKIPHPPAPSPEGEGAWRMSSLIPFFFKDHEKSISNGKNFENILKQACGGRFEF
jgi:hypothetical protein